MLIVVLSLLFVVCLLFVKAPQLEVKRRQVMEKLEPRRPTSGGQQVRPNQTIRRESASTCGASVITLNGIKNCHMVVVRSYVKV